VIWEFAPGAEPAVKAVIGWAEPWLGDGVLNFPGRAVEKYRAALVSLYARNCNFGMAQVVLGKRWANQPAYAASHWPQDRNRPQSPSRLRWKSRSLPATFIEPADARAVPECGWNESPADSKSMTPQDALSEVNANAPARRETL